MGSIRFLIVLTSGKYARLRSYCKILSAVVFTERFTIISQSSTRIPIAAPSLLPQAGRPPRGLTASGGERWRTLTPRAHVLVVEDLEQGQKC
jgi:hypothetical protein